MPDFVGIKIKEVISKDRKTIFLKNLSTIHFLDIKPLKKVLLKITKTKSQPGHFLILFLKFWQISGSCLL